MKNIFYSIHTVKIFTLLLLLTVLGTQAQRSRVSFDHIGTKEGLSESNILCIVQDSRGFMWFGTWDGLNRYDGYKITVFKNIPSDAQSISNNFINKIVEDKKGNLWIATSGGLNYFDRKKETFTRYLHQPNNSNSLRANSVADLVVDQAGKLWIGTNQGLDLYDPASNSFKHIPLIRNNLPGTPEPIRCMYKDSHDRIWVSVKDNGLLLYADEKQLTNFRRDLNDSNSIASNNINTIFEDSQHRIWFGANGRGLDLLDEAHHRFVHYHTILNSALKQEDVILAINEDADQHLWVSVENLGLLVFTPGKNFAALYAHDEIDHESITNNSVYGIYRDNKQNIWLANFAGWVDVAFRDKYLFQHYKRMLNINSISHNQVMHIREDRQHQIWLSTDGGGLDIFDPVQNKFTNYKHNDADPYSISGNHVLCTMEDHAGNTWIGTWKTGINVMDANKRVIKRFTATADTGSIGSNNAWKIFEDRSNNIWVATYGAGVERLNADGKTFTHYRFISADSNAICSTDINNIFQDSDGDIWFSSEDNGFCIWNHQTGKFTRFAHHEGQNSVSNNCVNSFYEDKDHNFWIGTLNGLNKFNKNTGLFKIYTAADGLAGDYVFGILKDEYQHFWLSTNKGISQFNPTTGAFKNYGTADGLQSNEFKQLSYCHASDGAMYFGGINGFNKFYPAKIKRISFDPPLVFTGISIYSKTVEVEKSNAPSPLKQSISESTEITLPYSNDVFSIEFASLNYSDADKKKYAYWLEGFDKTWSEFSSTRSVTYTHLDPGDYTFHLRGLDNDGKISSTVKSLHIYIRPPFWLTWWFKVFGIIASFGILYLAYKIRVKEIKKQQRQLEYLVSMQTSKLSATALESNLSKEREKLLRQEAEALNEELQEKNKELEQFAYVASHDLQEPLRTTVSFVKRLEKFNKDKLDEKSSKYLHFIVEATNRMQVLIKDLLEFSRIGKAMKVQQVDTNKVLENVKADLSVAIHESGAVINAQGLPLINGYPTEIKALFQNLLSNAIKFRKAETKPVIDITVQEMETCWYFIFKDNGIGIAEEHFNRIFAIFQRLHSSSEYAGSGIGLAHCKKIVELHGGNIWLSSVPGQGSEFHFDIAKQMEENRDGKSI